MADLREDLQALIALLEELGDAMPMVRIGRHSIPALDHVRGMLARLCEATQETR